MATQLCQRRDCRPGVAGDPKREGYGNQQFHFNPPFRLVAGDPKREGYGNNAIWHTFDFVVDVAGDTKREGYGNYAMTAETVLCVMVAGATKR